MVEGMEDDVFDAPVSEQVREMNPDEPVVVEIRSAERVETKDGTGVMLNLELRVGTKPWNGRKAFERLYIATSDKDNKGRMQGAASGSRKAKQICEAAGFLNLKDAKARGEQALAEAKRAIQIGLAEATRDEEGNKTYEGAFDYGKLKGRHFIGLFKMVDNEYDGSVTRIPKLLKAKPINIDEVNDVIKSCDFTRQDEAEAAGSDGEGLPPF
jgi:hypothetical protein